VPPPLPPEAGGGAPGRRGAPAPEEGAVPDKKLIWFGVGGGVLVILLIVVFFYSGRNKTEPVKKKAEETAATGERFPSHETEEGRAEIKKMFDSREARCSKYVAGIGPDVVMKLKDIMIPYLVGLDTTISFDAAYGLAKHLGKANDDRVVQKVIDLGLKKKSAHDLLQTYGAMGAEAVIARATKENGANLDTYESLLTESCKSDAAVPPIQACAETGAVAPVAWICGDVLYRRGKPIALARVQEWLASGEGRAQKSGIRQMSVQKDTDRDAAILPFSAKTADLEARRGVLEVASQDKTLSTEHIRNLLQIEDAEFFEEIAEVLQKRKLFEYIPDLEAVKESSMGTGRGRAAGRVAQTLKFARGDK
jgi:hypothetical protein